MSRKELAALDFEGILKYFRVSLPKKYRSEETVKQLFKLATAVKLKKLEKFHRDYLLIKGDGCSKKKKKKKLNYYFN